MIELKHQTIREIGSPRPRFVPGNLIVRKPDAPGQPSVKSVPLHDPWWLRMLPGVILASGPALMLLGAALDSIGLLGLGGAILIALMIGVLARF